MWRLPKSCFELDFQPLHHPSNIATTSLLMAWGEDSNAFLKDEPNGFASELRKLDIKLRGTKFTGV